MFYSHSLLSRKGPLGTIWIAAYCLRKLKRDQIADTDISSSIDKIMPEIQISYRLVAQLLLGIVRIFSKKVDYLYNDCNEALLTIRRSAPPTELVPTKKASAPPRGRPRLKVAREVARREPSPVVRQEEVDDGVITRPERFELDSFDLQISSEEGDASRPDEHSIFEDEWSDGRSQDSCLNECYQGKISVHAEFNDVCFTPMEEVFPSHLMEVDFEINEICNSSSLEARAVTLQEDSQQFEEHGNHEKLTARKSLAPILDEEAERPRPGHPEKMQETIPCDAGERLHVDTQVELMEGDFQITEICNSSSLEARTETLQEDSQQFEEHGNQEKLTARKSLAPIHDEEAERPRPGHPEKMQATIPCDAGERLHVDTQVELMEGDFEITEICNSSSLEARTETLQEDSQQFEECGNQEMLTVRKSLAPILDKEAERLGYAEKMQETIPCDAGERLHVDTQVELIKSHDTALSGHLELQLPGERCSEAATSEKNHDHSNKLADSGFTSPKFAVTTPAKKEHRRMFKKRKHFFDHSIVLSNEMLRLGLHDASSLVCKRRKVPLTYLDAWKACNITNLERNLLDPLIPCYFVELKASFEDTSIRSKVQRYSPVESIVVEDRSTDKSLADNLLLEGSFGDVQTTPNPPEETRPSKLFEVKTKEPSPIESVDSLLDLIDREPSYHKGKGCEQEDGWSVRTRAVAQYIYNRLLHGRELEGKEKLSLAQLLGAKTRNKCARFFCETLTLKTYGCIDVEQESPYADIIVSATPQLESMFKK